MGCRKKLDGEQITESRNARNQQWTHSRSRFGVMVTPTVSAHRRRSPPRFHQRVDRLPSCGTRSFSVSLVLARRPPEPFNPSASAGPRPLAFDGGERAGALDHHIHFRSSSGAPVADLQQACGYMHSSCKHADLLLLVIREAEHVRKFHRDSCQGKEQNASSQAACLRILWDDGPVSRAACLPR